MHRRHLLKNVAVAPLGIALSGPALAATSDRQATAAMANIQTNLERWVGFGIKAAGGEGDNASGVWIANHLQDCGFAVQRQSLSVPCFLKEIATFTAAATTVEVIPQAVVVATTPAGIIGRIERVDPRLKVNVTPGSIALIELPFRRWSTATAPIIREAVVAAQRQGAAAAMLVTTGPAQGAVALNAPGDAPLFDIPVACIGAPDARAALAAAARGETGRLVVAGQSGRRPAFNVIARMERKAARTIVVSTPRSGWFTCAGERGPGIVTFLELARWAPLAFPRHNLLFTCNTGHEYENAGSEELLRAEAPDPAKVDLWLHLGAGFAARDWQDLGSGVRPLDVADPQRAVVTTRECESAARSAFADLAGLSDPFTSEDMQMGETGTIIRAGYRRTVGLLGGHRFHHHPNDDLRCVDARLVVPVIAACKRLLASAASRPGR